MPLDPSIPLHVQAPAFNNPFEVLAGLQHQRAQQQLMQQQIQSNQALEDERRQRVAKEAQAARETTQINTDLGSAFEQNADGVWAFNRDKIGQARSRPQAAGKQPRWFALDPRAARRWPAAVAVPTA